MRFANGRPYLASAHCVRDGLVRTYDVLALPTSSRWGGTLIGIYVNERDAQYNLLDTIFSATDEGVVSLAAIRDAAGQPFDFQIVHLNEGASRLLKQPSTELLWRRLSAGGNLLCAPDVIERLRDIVAQRQWRPVRDRQRRSQSEAGRDRVRRHALADDFGRHGAQATAKSRSACCSTTIRCRCGCSMPRRREFLSVNDAAVQHYGYSRETFLRMQLRQIWPEDEWATHSQALQQIGDVYQFRAATGGISRPTAAKSMC